MDKYKVLEQLDKGVQEITHLVESVQDGSKYALKMIECKDEADANNAFTETMSFKELSHPNIQKYRELFISWEGSAGTLFLCLVFDHHQLGSLGKFITAKRQSGEKCELLILKKWIGQLFGALAYLHDKGKYHGFLKPDNITLRTDTDLCVGEFGVGAVSGYSDSFLDSGWNSSGVGERRDLWSLGCVILALSTTSTHDAAQFRSLLEKIRDSNKQALEAVLALVLEQYDTEICTVIRTLLQSTELSTVETARIPSVQNCIALSSWEGGIEDQQYEVLTKGGDLTAVFSYIEKHKHIEGAMIESFEYLAEMSRDEKVELDDAQKALVTTVMNQHIGESKVLVAMIELLQNLVVSIGPGDSLMNKSCISTVISAMRNHGNSAHLQAVSTALLMAMATDDHAMKLIGDLGGVQAILSALRNFPKDPVIGSNCCGALWVLCLCADNAAILIEECGLMDICSAIRTHKGEEELVENACSALWSLSTDEENVEIMKEQKVVTLLVQAIRDHMPSPKVVRNACITMGGILHVDEESGLQMLSDPHSVPTILEAFTRHNADPEVVNAICELVLAMSDRHELAAELASFPVVDLLRSVASNFPCIEEINQKAMMSVNALQKIKGV